MQSEECGGINPKRSDYRLGISLPLSSYIPVPACSENLSVGFFHDKGYYKEACANVLIYRVRIIIQCPFPS